MHFFPKDCPVHSCQRPPGSCFPLLSFLAPHLASPKSLTAEFVKVWFPVADLPVIASPSVSFRLG